MCSSLQLLLVIANSSREQSFDGRIRLARFIRRAQRSRSKQKHCLSKMASKRFLKRILSFVFCDHVLHVQSLGRFLVQDCKLKTDRRIVACYSIPTVCRPTGGMTAVPSREVTTSQVSAVTFGFYTEKEVSLLRVQCCRAKSLTASCMYEVPAIIFVVQTRTVWQ